MKKIIIASAIILLATGINAQTINVTDSKISDGKKLQVISIMKSNSSISSPQGDMEIPTTSTFTYQEDVTNVSETSITIISTLKRLQILGNMMGKDINIDTDDKNSDESKAVVQVLKQFNLPENFSVNTASIKGVIFDPKSITGPEIVSKLFVPVANIAAIKEGYSWKENIKDSLGSNEDITYTVTKASKTDIEITIDATVKSIANVQQNGMDMKHTNQGTVKGTRVYDAVSLILRSETENYDLTGAIEVMGQEMKTKNSGSVITSVK